MTAPDPRTAALEAAESAARDGRPLAALEQFAALHADDPADPRPYHGGFLALATAATTGDEAALPAVVARPQVTALLRAMIVQDACPERPRILHHRITQLHDRPNAPTARRVTAALLPVLDGLLADPAPPPGVVLLLTVTRRVMPADGPSQARISALHLARFPEFSTADLSLPYLVKFSARVFGANRADLLGRYRDARAARDPAAGLGLRHLVILDQLGRAPMFQPAEDDALAEAVALRLDRDPDNRDEVRAARALVMRYLRAPGGPAVDRLRRAGLAGELLDAAARWPRHDAVPPSAIPDLDGRARTYLSAGLNTLRMAAPALTKADRKPRVALCVSGQLRGFERAFATWRRALLPLAEVDIHVHTWSAVGRSAPHPTRRVLPFAGEAFIRAWRQIGAVEGYEGLKARQPRLLAALEADNRVDAARLQALYGTQSVVVEDETAPRFAGFSNQDKMHYKIHAADALARASGRTYDLVMRLRPDLAVTVLGVPMARLWRACRAGPVIFADGAFGLQYGTLMIGDQIAIGTPAVMARYAATWEDYGALARFDLAGVSQNLHGHAALAQTCWYAHIDVRRLPFKNGGLQDMAPLSSAGILSALQQDAAGRNDTTDAALIAAVQSDLER